MRQQSPLARAATVLVVVVTAVIILAVVGAVINAHRAQSCPPYTVWDSTSQTCVTP